MHCCLLTLQLKGSAFIEDINDKFGAQMTNVVRWQEGQEEGFKEIVSVTSLEVHLCWDMQYQHQ